VPAIAWLASRSRRPVFRHTRRRVVAHPLSICSTSATLPMRKESMRSAKRAATFCNCIPRRPSRGSCPPPTANPRWADSAGGAERVRAERGLPRRIGARHDVHCVSVSSLFEGFARCYWKPWRAGCAWSSRDGRHARRVAPGRKLRLVPFNSPRTSWRPCGMVEPSRTGRPRFRRRPQTAAAHSWDRVAAGTESFYEKRLCNHPKENAMILGSSNGCGNAPHAFARLRVHLYRCRGGRASQILLGRARASSIRGRCITARAACSSRTCG
jgi:hypothetical protein